MGDQQSNIFYIDGSRLVICPICENMKSIKIGTVMMHSSTICGHQEMDYIDKINEQDKKINLLEETVQELTERYES